jgi:ribosome biogenesis GTPase
MTPSARRVWVDDGGGEGRGRKGRRRERPPEVAVLVRQDARGCLARLGNGDEVWCSVRGKVHLEGNPRDTTPVAVGDRVHVRRTGGDRGSVVDVLARTSVLSRPDPHHERRQHLLAANVDQVVAVASAAEPPFAPGLVDRVLLAAEWSRLAAVLVVNKSDLVEEEPEECALYRRLGYPVLLASAATGRGVDALRDVLRGRVSVVTGHSGVGKTSLLNAVEPGLGLKVGTVNPVTRRGTHTTTAAVLFDLASGGAVVDTPGIREFGLYNVPRRELTWLFRDLREVAPRCRFKDCLHRGEPGCAVPAAVESGEVAAWRYDSYLRLLETTPDLRPWQIPGAK